MDGRSPNTCSREAIHDLDAGEIALVDRAVVALAGERLLVDLAVGVAVEEAAVARLELEHAAGRLVHERPGELLVVDQRAALEGVVEVRVDRVGRCQHRVVAALDHPRASGPAEQAFDGHADREAGGAVGRVQGGTEPGAPGAQHEDVRLDAVYREWIGHRRLRPAVPVFRSRRAAIPTIACATAPAQLAEHWGNVLRHTSSRRPGSPRRSSLPLAEWNASTPSWPAASRRADRPQGAARAASSRARPGRLSQGRVPVARASIRPCGR